MIAVLGRGMVILQYSVIMQTLRIKQPNHWSVSAGTIAVLGRGMVIFQYSVIMQTLRIEQPNHWSVSASGIIAVLGRGMVILGCGYRVVRRNERCEACARSPQALWIDRRVMRRW